MSLEQALAENTTAVKALSALIETLLLKRDGTTIAELKLVDGPEAIEAREDAKVGKKPPKATKIEKPVVVTKEAPKAEAPKLTYNELATKINKLAAKDRNKAIALLAGFKAKTLKDVGENDWPSFNEELDAVMA